MKRLAEMKPPMRPTLLHLFVLGIDIDAPALMVPGPAPVDAPLRPSDAANATDTATATATATATPARTPSKTARTVRPLHIAVTHLSSAASSTAPTLKTTPSTNPNGNWNEGFELPLSLHALLFGYIQLDLILASPSFLLSDKHIARSTIRISDVYACGPDFSSWYQLSSCNQADLLAAHDATPLAFSKTSAGIGAIHIRFKFQPLETAPIPPSLLQQQQQPSASDITEENENDTEDRPQKLPNAPPNFSLDLGIDLTTTKSSEDVPLILTSKIAAGDDQAMLESKLAESEDPSQTEAAISAQEQLFFDDAQDRDVIGKMIDSMFFLSKETKTILHLIRRLFAAFGFGIKSNPQLLTGLLALETFYKTIPPLAPTAHFWDLELIESARRMFRYSLAAYGWRGLTFFGKLTPALTDIATSKADLACILTFLKIPSEQVLLSSFDKTHLHERNFFVLHDPTPNNVIISIRGTMSPTDTLIDLACEYTNFENGYAHSGFLSSATWFYENILPDLITIIKVKKSRKLVIVGHSLGASVGSLLTILVLNSLERLGLADMGVVVECWAFAPPCCVSRDLATRPDVEKCIKSIVFGMDLVCRLSFGSLLDFKALLLTTMEICGTSATGFMKSMGESEQQELHVELRRIRADLMRRDRNPKLVVPGRILYLHDAPSTIMTPVLKTEKSSASASETLATASKATGLKATVSKKRTSTSTTATISTAVSATSLLTTALESTGISTSTKTTTTPTTAIVRSNPSSGSSSSSSLPSLTKHRVFLSSISPPNDSPHPFGELELRRSMLMDHLPSSYDFALENCHMTHMVQFRDRDVDHFKGGA